MCDALLSGIWFVGCFALGEMVAVGAVFAGHLFKKKYDAAKKAAEPVQRKRELRAR